MPTNFPRPCSSLRTTTNLLTAFTNDRRFRYLQDETGNVQRTILVRNVLSRGNGLRAKRLAVLNRCVPILLDNRAKQFTKYEFRAKNDWFLSWRARKRNETLVESHPVPDAFAFFCSLTSPSLYFFRFPRSLCLSLSSFFSSIHPLFARFFRSHPRRSMHTRADTYTQHRSFNYHLHARGLKVLLIIASSIN